ncbi:MAG TPA: type II CAAX endopeptidase family protein [Roseiflexaceae bacterium]|nr:type II CAAX endopeptidase family protein [Roseiflexaceae bacterium]
MSTLVATSVPSRWHTLMRLLARHPVRSYLLIAFGVSYVLFLPSLLSVSGFGLLPFDLPLKPFVLLSSLLALALPAALISRAVEGRGAAKRLFAQCVRWRVGLRWYVMALIGMPLACLLSAIVWRGPAALSLLASTWPQFFTALLPKALIIAALVSIWEETGWTGFMLPRLQRRMGPLPASLLVNLSQATLHVPLLFVVDGLSDGRLLVNQYPEYLLYLFIFTIPMRIIMTWLYNGTGGSMLIVALFHGMWNTTASSDFVSLVAPGSDATWVFAVLAACALLVLLLTRGRLGYTAEPEPQLAHATPARI